MLSAGGKFSDLIFKACYGHITYPYSCGLGKEELIRI